MSQKLESLNFERTKVVQLLESNNLILMERQKYELKIIEIEKQISKINELTEAEKQIHVIWIGKIPEEEFDKLKIWAKFNPDFQINIWTDSEHFLTPKLNSLIRNQVKTIEEEAVLKDDFYYNYFLKNPDMTFDEIATIFLITKQLSTELEIKQFIQDAKKELENNKEKLKQFTSNKIYIKDLSQKKDNIFLNNEIYEVYLEDLEHYHFAASASDILRYSILYKEGGIYLDTDTTPKFDIEKIKDIPGMKEVLKALVNDSEHSTGKPDYNKEDTILNEVILSLLFQKENILKLSNKWSEILGGNKIKNFNNIKKIFELIKESNLELVPIKRLKDFSINNSFAAVTYERPGNKIFSSFLISKKGSNFWEKCLAKIVFYNNQNKNLTMVDRLANQEQIVINQKGPYLLREIILNENAHFFKYHPSEINNFCSMSSLNSINSTWFQWKPSSPVSQENENLIQECHPIKSPVLQPEIFDPAEQEFLEHQ